MKLNKKLLIPLISAVVLLVVGATILLLVNANSLSSYNKRIVKSLKKVSAITTVLEVKDNNSLVYKNVSLLELDSNTGKLTNTTSKLNKSFVLEETSNFEMIENIDRNNLLSLNLNKSSLMNYKKNKNGFTCEVSKENAKRLFNTDSFESSSNIELNFVFENKKLSSITCSYITESNFSVNICTSYAY